MKLEEMIALGHPFCHCEAFRPWQSSVRSTSNNLDLEVKELDCHVGFASSQ